MFKDRDFRDNFVKSEQFKQWNDILIELLRSVPTITELHEEEIDSKVFDLKDDLMHKSIELGLHYKSLEEGELPEPMESNKVSEDFEEDLQAFSENVQELTLKTLDYNRLTDNDLIELIKDLQVTGIDNKAPEDVLKKLKDLRDSRE